MVQPRPAIGYAMAAVAATLFAVNGTVSKVALASGISSGQRRDLARGSAQRGGRRGPASSPRSYASYVLIAERGVRRREPISLSVWGFFFATLFWTIAALVELPRGSHRP